MERASIENQEIVFHDYESLRLAEHFSPIISIIDQSTRKHYRFRKYCLMGNWGICNGDKTKRIVKEKSYYATVEILSFAPLLVAGSSSTGWDVYSLNGNLLRHLPPMSLDEATNYLDEKNRNSH